MELREKIASLIFDAPLNPSDKACHAIADAILAIPEIAEGLAYRSLCRCVTPLDESYLGHLMSGDTCTACGITAAELRQGHPNATQPHI